LENVVVDDVPKVSTMKRRCCHTRLSVLHVRLAMRATFQPVRMVSNRCWLL
jgi:hypothetical protein